MERVLFYIHHPAQFHLFKNAILYFQERAEVTVVATKKDILEDLLKDAGIEYINVLPNGRKDNKFAIALALLAQDFRLLKICIRKKPQLLIGTSTEITHIGKLLSIPSIFVNEDDVEIIPLVGKLAYPFAKWILAPDVCSVGKWEDKKIAHSSYHELAYLHPNNFQADFNVVKRYLGEVNKYFILRFAKLGAHHDAGRKGISDELALQIVNKLKPHGKVIISAEREIDSKLEPYRMRIDPLDIHHLMAFASGYIGDSQTMAAEAGVLGVPFIRYNDFVGQIGYLSDLEENFRIGEGVLTKDVEIFFAAVDRMLDVNAKAVAQNRRQKMLEKKKDLNQVIIEIIETYPKIGVYTT